MNNHFYFLGFPGYPFLEFWGLLWKAAVGMK
jgi:hypothetical protein